MRRPTFTNQFSKDIKLFAKRGKDLSKAKAVMSDIIREEPLQAKSEDHALQGEYKGHRECHIEPDWLLIYMLKDCEVRFVRMGTHSDLFK